jgi:hypothetical protein
VGRFGPTFIPQQTAKFVDGFPFHINQLWAAAWRTGIFVRCWRVICPERLPTGTLSLRMGCLHPRASDTVSSGSKRPLTSRGDRWPRRSEIGVCEPSTFGCVRLTPPFEVLSRGLQIALNTHAFPAHVHCCILESTRARNCMSCASCLGCAPFSLISFKLPVLCVPCL